MTDRENGITHPEMVKNLAKPGANIVDQLTANSAHILHMAVGIAGEAGEILEEIHEKKSMAAVSIENITEELGDLEFYIEGFRQGMGFKRDDTISTYSSDDFKHHGEDVSDAYIVASKLAMYALKLLDEAKKFSIYVKVPNALNMRDDLTMIEVCLEHLRQHFDILYEDCINHNIDKLATGENARYGEGKYSNKQAQDRVDKQ